MSLLGLWTWIRLLVSSPGSIGSAKRRGRRSPAWMRDLGLLRRLELVPARSASSGPGTGSTCSGESP
eukprot:732676-Pyramimonas_sp.AAC.1